MSTTESSFSLLGSESDTDETLAMSKQKIVVVGAGPVGALAAIYAAQRGHDVEIYELRNDLRDPSTTPLNFTKSINLALSERGINAIRHSGRRDLLDKIMEETIPMRGRMIHGKKGSGELFEESQDYDIHGRTNFAVDRGGLNKRLLDGLESLPNVKFFFNHKLVGADFKQKKAWFEAKSQQNTEELEVNFDLLIGADGAHSAARYHLMKYTRMDYRQEYIDTLWCEFTIEPKEDFQKDLPDSKFRISPNHLHIWPGKEHMFIAIPSIDGSFTCTLFMPAAEFTLLETRDSQIHPFFEKYFPGVTSFIKPEDLVRQFKSNPHLPLISINCQPYHYGSSAVIVGDAAHAMVPFYGQGMNAGLESVRILFSQLDAHPSDPAAALAEYSRVRAPDAAAINELALQNYIEMRASVTSPLYKLRKWLEESLSVYVPSLGWATKYSRVSFGNERYSEVVKKAEHQGNVIRWALGTVTAMPFIGLGILTAWKWRSVFGTARLAIKK